MKACIDQHLRLGRDNLKIESFQSAAAMLKLLSELDFRLGNDSWIEDDSHIFGILYYRNIYKCIQFLLAHLSFQAYLDFKPLRLSDTKGRQIHSVMNMRDWWWDTQDQLPAGAMTVPVICASNQTH